MNFKTEPRSQGKSLRARNQSIELLNLRKEQLQNELNYSQRRIAKSLLLQSQLNYNIDQCYLKIKEVDEAIQTLEKAQSTD